MKLIPGAVPLGPIRVVAVEEPEMVVSGVGTVSGSCEVSATPGSYRWHGSLRPTGAAEPTPLIIFRQTLDMDVDHADLHDAALQERAETVLRQAFIAAQIGMPSEDRETAVETLWIILESLLVDHLAPDASVLEDRAERRTTLETHWRRLVTAAVTNTFVLGGVFVMPEELLRSVEQRALQHLDGSLWHTRRPPGPGALVLAVHRALEQLDRTARRGEFAGKADAEALVELISFATLGAVMSGPQTTPRAPDDEARGDGDRGAGRWIRDGSSAAAAFGIPGVELVSVRREGWACDSCGCVFAGRVEAGIAYPDRLAPVGRGGPCDAVIECACHRAPLQREVR